MIEAPPTLIVNTARRRPTTAQIAALQNTPAGFVADALGGGGALERQIQPLGAGSDLSCTVAGPALTADCGPGDVLALFAALKFVAPGDIVVAAFAAHSGCAAGGDALMGRLKNGGAAGFVTDGPLRDHDGIAAVGLPVWCAGLTPASPHMSGPGSIGFPVQIGGQQVGTGDMIVADRDGVVVVPFARLDEVIAKLVHIRALEAQQDATIAGGEVAPPWVDDLLASDRTAYTD